MTTVDNPAPILDRLLEVAHGRGLGTEADRLAAVALACGVLQIDPNQSAVVVWAAANAHRRAVERHAEAVLTLAECALAACLDAEAGLPRLPGLAEAVARCERVLARGEA